MSDFRIFNNYDSVIKLLTDKKFFIFGNTNYANIFYIYCKENGIDKNITAFVVSDYSKDKRKVHMMHGHIPVWDIEELRKHKNIKNGFLAVSEKILDELSQHFKDFNLKLYYVSKFTHDLSYYGLMNKYYKNITDRYIIKSNYYGADYINIMSDNKDVYFKYASRIRSGVLPDINIFSENINIDSLFKNQLGYYKIIIDTKSDKPTEKICRIYTAKSHFDKELKEEYPTPHTVTIQVGTALTNSDISEIKDNIGDNISLRNKDYCEMTAAYWIWKNDTENDYVGLCHYRRRFAVDEKILNEIIYENYDAVYAVPQLTDGGMKAEFVDRNYYITPEMWELTAKAIQKLSPDYYDSWIKFGESYFLIPCNMLIMRRDVYNDYCSWIFEILEDVDNFYLKQGIQRNDRYLGYIAECLNTVYVMKNKDKLKKAFVEMRMLETK